MFEKILYPTDFSDVARKALAALKELRISGAQEVVTLHVIEPRGIDVLSEFAAPPASVADLEKAAAVNMERLDSELCEAGFKVTHKIVPGLPVTEILKTAEEEKVSAIVIGSHGKSNLAEMLLGSVSEKVVRKAVQPVLVVKR